jgi:murein DD-endopeptidase MepM/ murein hydrolase activator NlpD
LIDHGSHLVTAYFHMGRILVRPGQRVKKGQVLGLVGAKGFATGPHLHWQMTLNGVAIDPLQWLSRSQLALLRS